MIIGASTTLQRQAMLEKSVRLRTKQQAKTTLSHAYTIIKNSSNNKSFKQTPTYVDYLSVKEWSKYVKIKYYAMMSQN